jgi:hypothetical protein
MAAVRMKAANFTNAPAYPAPIKPGYSVIPPSI